MYYGFVLLGTALILSLTAEYYSIVGLTAIFAAAAIPVIVMGASLGLGKVVGTVWLHNNWARVPWSFKLYLVPAIVFLMFLTSIGVFGFLSKAHLEQATLTGDASAQVALFDEKIKTQRDNIEAARQALKQMDATVDQTIARSTDTGSVQIASQLRKRQQKERADLQNEISKAQAEIAQLQEQRAPLAMQSRKIEAEVGPLKYIAALIYGDNPDSNLLERAVRWVIILIIIVFEPFALCLILAANLQFEWARKDRSIHSPHERNEDSNLTEIHGTVDTVNEEPVQIDSQEIPDPVDTQVVNKPEPESNSIELATVLDHQVIDQHVERVPTEPTTELPPESTIIDYEPIIVEHREDEVADLIIESVQSTEPEPPIDTELHFEQVEVEHIDPNTRIKSTIIKRVPSENISEVVADNQELLPTATRSDFGTTFPSNASKGDTYLRIDYFPAKLFKFNGQKWFEVDKTSTDSYAFNEEYIKYLIDKINTGEYSLDNVTEVEQDQMAEYLRKTS